MLLSIRQVHEILSKPTGDRNAIEVGYFNALVKVFPGNLDKLALFAKLSVELKVNDIDHPVIKI